MSDVYLRSRHKLVPHAPLVHPDDDVRAWIHDVLIPSGAVTVALAGGVVVGMLAVATDENSGWVEQLYVDPDHVGGGIGSMLLRHARSDLGSPVRLFTFQASSRARAFYEREGFVAIAFGDGSTNEEGCPDVLYEWRA